MNKPPANNHSATPWEVVFDDGWTIESPPVGGDAEFSARVVVDMFHRGKGKQVCADAHLIAAAPDLLKACKELIVLAEQHLIEGNAARLTAYSDAAAAVAKAEGKLPE